MDRRRGVGEHTFQGLPAFDQRFLGEVRVVDGEQVEGNEAGRGLLGQQRHPAGGGVDALLEGLEVECVACGVGDDDLTVDDGPLGEVGQHSGDDLGKLRVTGRSLRLPISTSSPSRKMIDRKPSHFGS